ncbi:MAG TPA: hypothetical protein VIH21_11345 [Dehalococcoidia bacterium]|jgi:hypothetical protein
MRILAFVLALLLLAGNVEPTRNWLIVLSVLTGVAAFRARPWAPFRPALDVRMAAFVFAVLLLAGTIEPTKDWLIVLSAVTGIAAFMPGLVSLDHEYRWNRFAYLSRRSDSRSRGRWDWDGDVWR